MDNNHNLKFTVFGANGNEHEVTIIKDINNPTNLSAHCSCGESLPTDFCEHRFTILEGDESVLASTNRGDFDRLQSWVQGSDIETAMNELSKAKMDLRLVKDRVADCKKNLAKQMLD